VYAVGNILYEMLCGATPFHSDTDYRLMKDKLEKQPNSILPENPSVPVALEKIIFKALQRNPEKRYQTAREMKTAIEKCLDGALLDQATLTKVLRASQVFTVPEKGNEIISVGKILSRAKSISGKFKVPEFGGIKVPAFSKINKPILILGASVLLCAILLLWGAGSDTENMEEKSNDALTVTWEEPMEQVQEETADRSSGNFNETPSEMYQRIAEPTKETAKPSKNNLKKNGSSNTERTPSNTEERTKSSENTVKESKVSHPPAEVPAGKEISVTLQEDLSSEEKERDGKQFRLTSNEDVVADNRVIIRKGATVMGKIVDCVPSNDRKKALIGFVIQYVEAVDGSRVNLKSERFRLYADVPGKPVFYRAGQTFGAILKRGTVN
jgi:serine/threonine-protein kinase